MHAECLQQGCLSDSLPVGNSALVCTLCRHNKGHQADCKTLSSPAAPKLGIPIQVVHFVNAECLQQDFLSDSLPVGSSALACALCRHNKSHQADCRTLSSPTEPYLGMPIEVVHFAKLSAYSRAFCLTHCLWAALPCCARSAAITKATRLTATL